MIRKLNKNHAIGVFDSGLGGLTVVKEMMRELPYEDIVYFGDTARVPYGTKSKETIVRFSIENTLTLLKQNIKMIVVACNTCSSYALPKLRRIFHIPVVGVIEPGAAKAVRATHNKKIGVIATAATIKSQAYTKELLSLDPSIKVLSQKCTLFVPLVEEGWLETDVTRQVADHYLKDMKRSKIDTLILGCTHYPLLKNTLKQTMGKGVALIDSAQEVAQEVRHQLELGGGLRDKPRKPKHMFLVSDRPEEFQAVARKFLGKDIKKMMKVRNV